MRKTKEVSEATRAMLDEMTADANKPASVDKVAVARTKVAELRDLERRKADLEEAVKQTNKDIEKIKWQELPDLLGEAKLESMTIEAEGNLPAFTVEVDDHYHANIPKENEDRAFAWLHKQGMGDMVKTTFTISFGLGETEEMQAFKKRLDKLKEPYEVKQAVPWNTLTSWIKGEFKAKRPIPEKVMGMLGATIKRVANVKKPKKEK